METFLRNHFVLRRSVLFSLVVICLVFIIHHAEAADPGNGLFKELTSSLHLTVSRQVEQTKDISVEPQKVYSEEITSTPHVRVSLSDTMKLFFNMQPTSKDYYDKRNNINRACTMLGLDILF
jgi:hypothetical protein